MAFAVSSTKSASGRGKGKMAEQMTKVTTSLNSEFRCRRGRARQDESGAGTEPLFPFFPAPRLSPRLWEWERIVRGWYWFSSGTFLLFVYLHYYFSLATIYTSLQIPS